MTTRPGTADGRAFGLSAYMPVGAIDARVMRANNIADATQYRAFVQNNGATLMQTFGESARDAVSGAFAAFGCSKAADTAPVMNRPYRE